MKSENFSQGFDRGNYGNAYESQDWETWYAEECVKSTDADYAAGLLLGFFSSYELDEIGDEYLRDEVAHYRLQYGEEV